MYLGHYLIKVYLLENKKQLNTQVKVAEDFKIVMPNLGIDV